MAYDPDRHHRRSIRLRGYDYARGGAYFLTICAQDRACLFADIVAGDLCLNAAGRMIQSTWQGLPAFYPGVDIDEFVVMPNHVHGIVMVADSPMALSLPDLVHRFKTLTTKCYTDGVKGLGWAAFRGRLWQRNYHEHIIRNEDALHCIRQYIADNPSNWPVDRDNPQANASEPKDAWRA